MGRPNLNKKMKMNGSGDCSAGHATMAAAATARQDTLIQDAHATLPLTTSSRKQLDVVQGPP